MELKDLWQRRFNQLFSARMIVLRRIANGYMILPVLLIIMGLYYYPIFIEWLPQNFPVYIAFSIILALINSTAGYRSLLQEADLLYLLPVETRLKSYFTRSFIYNWAVQSLFLISFIVVISPLLIARIDSSTGHLLLFTLILLVLKGWNLTIHWYALQFTGSNVRRIFLLLRLLINLMLIYGLLRRSIPLIGLGLFCAAAFTFLQQALVKKLTLNWHRLIQVEKRLDARFDAWLSLFMDTPQPRSGVKRDWGMSSLARSLAFIPQKAYHYLFIKLFFRTEISGMMVRITIIGMILTFFISEIRLLILAYMGILLIAGIQLSSFWQVLIHQYWVKLYPLPAAYLKKAYLENAFILLISIGLLLLLTSMLNMKSFLLLVLMSIIGGLVAYAFTFLYLKRKIKLSQNHFKSQ
jgi:ABC-2 type transport system permease protein